MKDEKYLELLAEKYPTEQAVCREIINLKAILSLPKGTEHFMSDLHGVYEAFCHILNNCSGVPCSTICPRYITTMLEDKCFTTERS